MPLRPDLINAGWVEATCIECTIYINTRTGSVVIVSARVAGEYYMNNAHLEVARILLSERVRNATL